MMNGLEAKVAVITGGGTGIGRGVALALGSLGARVVVCGRREGRLEETIQAIKDAGGEALAVRADVSSLQDIERLVDTALQQFGKIDILINNAAVFKSAPAHQVELESWDKMMGINLRGPFLLMRQVLPHMQSQQSGHIINISSESALNYYSNDTVYGLTKHALNDLGEYIQRENQDFNIRVNTICPGMVVTEMTENSPGLDHSKCLYPEDIADLVIWLLTRRQNIKIGTPILIQTMKNPWK